MLRVWIVSGLVVAALVAGILILTSDPAPGDSRPADGRPAQRRALSEKEVRSYLSVMPEITASLGEVFEAIQRGAEPVGDHRARIDAILQRHHLTWRDWGSIRRRVEGAVDAYRWELAEPERTRQRQQAIREKEALLETAEGPLRAQLEKDLEALRRGEEETRFPPLQDADRELVKRFWSDLDRTAHGFVPELPRR